MREIPPPKPPALEGRLADYVSAFRRALGGTPSAFSSRYECEIADHLRLLVEDGLARGMSVEEAETWAIRQVGRPDEIASTLLEAYYDDSPARSLTRALGRGVLVAFSIAAVPQLVSTWLLAWKTHFPEADLARLAVDPTWFRELGIASAPLIGATPVNAALYAIALVAPWIVGFAVGQRLPVRPSRYLLAAQTVLAAYALAFGASLWPTTDGLLIALVHVVYGLPVSCGLAHRLGQLGARRRAARARGA